MSWTKRQFILAALEEIGIGSYQFDIQPEMMELAQKRLDAMFAEWNAKGIRLGYPAAGDPTKGDLDDDTLVPDMANAAVYLNLAVKIARPFGKQLTIDLKTDAFNAYNAMVAKNITIDEKQYNQSVPAGAGSKLRRLYSPYLSPPEDTISDTDGDINFS